VLQTVKLHVVKMADLTIPHRASRLSMEALCGGWVEAEVVPRKE